MNHYTVEKMTNAIKCLATHPGDARRRVISAYYCINTLKETDFPHEYRKKWSRLLKNITKHGPLLGPCGDVIRCAAENTMYRRKNKTASKLATEIYDLYWQVSNNHQYH